MYKLLFFLNKTDDENVLQFFKDNTVKKLEELIGGNVGFAEVESNLLLEQKYTYYCEINVDRVIHNQCTFVSYKGIHITYEQAYKNKLWT